MKLTSKQLRQMIMEEMTLLTEIEADPDPLLSGGALSKAVGDHDYKISALSRGQRWGQDRLGVLEKEIEQQKVAVQSLKKELE